MKTITSAVLAAALVTGLGVSAVSASSVDQLIPTNGASDRSADARAATMQNIATLGVDLRPGRTLTPQELTAIQRIVLDQGNFASKAGRVDRIVNSDRGVIGSGSTLGF